MKDLFLIPILMFAFSIFTSVPVEAAVSCKLAHGKKAPWVAEIDDARPIKASEIDPKKVRMQGFRLDKDRLLGENGKLLGRLAVLEIRYLYEWASEAYHEAWLKTGGIDEAYMKRILDRPRQRYGKGFYVSVNPGDSAQYGAALTVFPVKGRLIILVDPVSGLEGKGDLLRRLGKAGVDALTNDSLTWLAVISHRHLQNPQRFEDTLLRDWKIEKPDYREIKEVYDDIRMQDRQKYVDLIDPLLKPEDRW